MNQHAKIAIRHSTCPHDCPSACALDIEVVEGRIYPEITGSAFVNSEASLILDERDPFCYGIRGTWAKATT